jgi:hypothetical protein
MTYAPTAASVLAWSVQVLAAAGLATAASALLRRPRARLAVWQSALALILVLALAAPLVPYETPPRTPRHFWSILGAGAAARLLWLAAGLRRLRRLRRSAAPIKDLPDSRPGIRWYASKRLPAAIVFGWRRPWIVLPSGVLSLPARHREAIVRHLIEHIARGDWLMALGEELLRALFWFHPAVWYAIARVQQERERAIDAAIAGETGEPAALRAFLPASARDRWYRLSPGRTCF